MPNPSSCIRVLFLADSHLGFDLPTRPRVRRRRRGHDFLANHREALSPALAGDVDLVIHGGDLFHRPRVPKSLVYQAFEPLLEVARRDVPVFVVPGNHERSRIPHAHLGAHPLLHVFGKPESVRIDVRGSQVAVAGFPYERRKIRDRFPEVLSKTDWRDQGDDLRILAMHHCVEGATVGPADFMFTTAPDVIRCSDLPGSVAAVLSGHIHRQQVLRVDLEGRRLPVPVIYPGSVERTAFAEKGEVKGFMVLSLEPGEDGGRVAGHEFRELYARPMSEVVLKPKASEGLWEGGALLETLRKTVMASPKDAVLRVKLDGTVPSDVKPLLSAESLRCLAPPSMNLDLILPDRPPRTRSRQRTERTPASPSPQMDLAF